jgi:hypothetical protein
VKIKGGNKNDLGIASPGLYVNYKVKEIILLNFFLFYNLSLPQPTKLIALFWAAILNIHLLPPPNEA